MCIRDSSSSSSSSSSNSSRSSSSRIDGVRMSETLQQSFGTNRLTVASVGTSHSSYCCRWRKVVGVVVVAVGIVVVVVYAVTIEVEESKISSSCSSRNSSYLIDIVVVVFSITLEVEESFNTNLIHGFLSPAYTNKDELKMSLY